MYDLHLYVFSWIKKLFFHRLHILDFQMLYTETRNQGKKNGNVVRTYIWIRPVLELISYSFSLFSEQWHHNNQFCYFWIKAFVSGIDVSSFWALPLLVFYVDVLGQTLNTENNYLTDLWWNFYRPRTCLSIYLFTGDRYPIMHQQSVAWCKRTGPLPWPHPASHPHQEQTGRTSQEGGSHGGGTGMGSRGPSY